jgi:hypothetical protein
MKKKIGFILCVLGVTIMSAPVPVKGHSWYPLECCHQMDCAPIVKEEGSTVTTIHGTVIVPQNFKPVRPSQDNKSHACIVNNKLICIFRPTGV